MDAPEFTLYISKKEAVKDGYSGYFGVTPSRIYFEQCTIQFMFSTLSKEKIKIVDPSKSTFDVEFKMKQPAKDIGKVRAILLRELTKAFSIMKQP